MRSSFRDKKKNAPLSGAQAVNKPLPGPFSHSFCILHSFFIHFQAEFFFQFFFSEKLKISAIKMSDDPLMAMYEAQAIEKQQEIDRLKREKEELLEKLNGEKEELEKKLRKLCFGLVYQIGNTEIYLGSVHMPRKAVSGPVEP